MKYSILFVTLCSILFSSCNSCSPREKINKGGEIVGTGVGEFVQGMSNGAQNAFEVNCKINQNLTANGVSRGKIVLKSDSVGTDNLLSVYLVFIKAFNGTITAKAFDGKSLEMGRTSLPVNSPAGSAGWFDFIFDRRTDIDNDSRIELE